MVNAIRYTSNSPRIRGDGPNDSIRTTTREVILPVFAGMVPVVVGNSFPVSNSPRIRGDGPARTAISAAAAIFSPYSRGWSVTGVRLLTSMEILPVFAGMVPVVHAGPASGFDSPRIRGDGPDALRHVKTRV